MLRNDRHPMDFLTAFDPAINYIDRLFNGPLQSHFQAFWRRKSAKAQPEPNNQFRAIGELFVQQSKRNHDRSHLIITCVMVLTYDTALLGIMKKQGQNRTGSVTGSESVAAVASTLPDIGVQVLRMQGP